jgi:hypothetical protein
LRISAKALNLQFNVSRASAIMALRLCEDSEERADDLITALPSTKRFVQFLAKPALVHILKSTLNVNLNVIGR